MKRALSLVLLMALLAGFTASAIAQDASNVSDSLDTLRSQLLDAQAKEAELEARQQQLDEALNLKTSNALWQVLAQPNLKSCVSHVGASSLSKETACALNSN
jgi:hypothetical protein